MWTDSNETSLLLAVSLYALVKRDFSSMTGNLPCKKKMTHTSPKWENMNETYDEMYTGKEIILLRWENREVWQPQSLWRWQTLNCSRREKKSSTDILKVYSILRYHSRLYQCMKCRIQHLGKYVFPRTPFLEYFHIQTSHTFSKHKFALNKLEITLYSYDLITAGPRANIGTCC